MDDYNNTGSFGGGRSFNNDRGGQGSFGGQRSFDRPPTQMHPVDPPVQCAFKDENGTQCEVMITELPFPLNRDENGEPLKPVFCREHKPARRPFGGDRSFGGGDRGGYRPSYR